MGLLPEESFFGESEREMDQILIPQFILKQANLEDVSRRFFSLE